MKPSDSPPATEEVRRDDLLDFLRGKLATAEQALKARLQSEACWSGGTSETWRNSGCKMTKAQRLEESARQGRIAKKCRHEVAMFKAAIAALEMAGQAATEEISRLRHGIDCAANALTDSILCSGNDAKTNLHFVRKLRALLSSPNVPALAQSGGGNTPDSATASALLPAAGLLCGCGRPVQYSHGEKHSCNKRVVCPTYEELRERFYRANALVMAYREKRKWDGLNGRTWSASKHFEAEARIEELESHNDEMRDAKGETKP